MASGRATEARQAERLGHGDRGGRRHAQPARTATAERQRLLIREANYQRKLVGLPPVRAEGEMKGESGRK